METSDTGSGWSNLAALFSSGLPPRLPVAVLVASHPFGPAERAGLDRARRRNAPVELVLSPALLLRKTVEIPVAARKEAEAAIALRLRQMLPAKGAGLTWRLGAKRRDRGTLSCDVWLLKNAELTALADDATRAGVELRAIRIEGLRGARPLLDNSRTTDRGDRLWNVLALLAVLAIGGALGAAHWTRLAALSERTEVLNAQVAALQERAVAARARAESRDAELAAMGAVMRHFAQEYRRLPILADLTQRLGDDVWLSSVVLAGGELRLAGFSSGDVGEVVAQIKASPWAKSVDLDGAVVVDPERQQRRFQLRVALAGEEAS